MRTKRLTRRTGKTDKNTVIVISRDYKLCIMQCVSFLCRQMAPVGDVVLLYNLSVVWTSFFESFWRKQWRLKVQIPSLILCLGGMVLVTKPSFIFYSSSLLPPSPPPPSPTMSDLNNTSSPSSSSSSSSASASASASPSSISLPSTFFLGYSLAFVSSVFYAIQGVFHTPTLNSC